jgi:hypothetical protein
MSPELEAILDAEAAAQSAAKASIEHSQRTHGMAYATLRGALRATTTFNRPRQF